MSTKKLDYQFIFVKFPIIFPLIYICTLYLFPSFETELIILTILFLAEPHFGATWPFFLNRINKEYIKENKFFFIKIPIVITILCVLGFFLAKSFFLLIFFASNIYHVTRQSLGVSKLYSSNFDQLKNIELNLYIWNTIFFLIGFFRFYYPVITPAYVNILNITIASFLMMNFIYYFFKFKLTDNFFTLITGVIIFYPICFVANPVHAILMGVTMHYSQYLILTYGVTKNRELKVNPISKNYYFIFVIIFYSILMTIFSSAGKANSELLKNLIIIPITAQMLHFYLDSRLWKFSENHNRKAVLGFLHLKKQ